MEYVNKIKDIIDEYLKLKELKKYNYFENINEEHIKIKVEIELKNENGNSSDNELIKELDYKFEYCGFEKINNFNKEKNTNNKIKYSYKLDKEKLKLSEEQFNSKIKLLFQKVEAYIKLNKRPQSPEEIPTDKKILEKKIVYWSEGNKYLEELLTISLENGYTSHACCAGHEDKKNKANIVYKFNLRDEKYIKFINEIYFNIKDNTNYSIGITKMNDENITVAFHSIYGYQNKLFDLITKIIKNKDNLESITTNNKTNKFMDEFNKISSLLDKEPFTLCYENKKIDTNLENNFIIFLDKKIINIKEKLNELNYIQTLIDENEEFEYYLEIYNKK